MTIGETREITDILHRVQSWPITMRIALARQILESLELAGLPAQPRSRRGYSVEEIRAILKTDMPAPDDTTVQEWVEEHRMEKYGRCSM
jgi:hypothetical protein